MVVFNIIKPDMINHSESISYYFDFVNSNFDSSSMDTYLISNWVELAKKIYELEVEKQTTSIEKLKKTKEILTTILGYSHFYKENNALLNIYDVPSRSIEALDNLVMFKKDLRKKYVYNTDKYYIKTVNFNESNYQKPLSMININNIELETFKIPFNKSFDDESFNMVYFNKLHFPDPDPIAILKEFKILEEVGIISNKNKVKLKGIKNEI